MEKEQFDHQEEKKVKEPRIIVLVVVMIVGGVLFLLSFVPALLWFTGNYDSNTPAQFTPTPSPVPALSRTLDSDTFPDEAFRKYLSENVDLNGDGGLDVLEYEEVTELHLNGLGIKNLEGIGKFYYLAAHRKCCKGSICPDGRFLVCSQAVHAAQCFVSHAGSRAP